MIARIHHHWSFGRTVRYCHRNSIAGRPLASSVLLENPSDEGTVIDEFCRVSDAREAVRPVVQISIYVRDRESLSEEQWLLVAGRVRNEMGFEDCPWAAYLHHNKNGRKGQHLHLVLSRVSYGGKLVSDRDDRYRVMKVIRDLERELGLGLQQSVAEA